MLICNYIKNFVFFKYGGFSSQHRYVMTFLTFSYRWQRGGVPTPLIPSLKLALSIKNKTQRDEPPWKNKTN